MLKMRTLAYALVLLAAAMLGCASAASPPPAQAERTIYVVSHGWHTGIVLRRGDIPAGLWPESADFPNAEYLEVGWGDRDYYIAPAFDLWLATKALLWPTASVLHVVGFSGSVADNFPLSEIVELRVSAENLEPLVRLIHDSHVREGDARAASIARGLYGDGRFYPSRERFHLFNTCNVWTSRALRAAGFPIRAATAGGVVRAAAQAGRCLRCEAGGVPASP